MVLFCSKIIGQNIIYFQSKRTIKVKNCKIFHALPDTFSVSPSLSLLVFAEAGTQETRTAIGGSRAQRCHRTHTLSLSVSLSFSFLLLRKPSLVWNSPHVFRFALKVFSPKFDSLITVIDLQLILEICIFQSNYNFIFLKTKVFLGFCFFWLC